MPSPTQSNAPLARIQPVKQELPSLDQMRADLLAIEADLKSQQFLPEMNPQLRRLFQIFAGSQRTIVDHLRLMVGGQRMMAQSLQKYVDTKIVGLANEVNAAFASLNEQPQPEAEVAPEASQGAEPVAAEPVQPDSSPAPTVAAPSPAAPQMTVTPVVRTGRAQRQAAQKAGAK